MGSNPIRSNTNNQEGLALESDIMFPCWIVTDDNEVEFLNDKDVEHAVAHGVLQSWKDGLGHAAIEKITGKTGIWLTGGEIPPEMVSAFRAGELRRMAMTAGYDTVMCLANMNVGRVLVLGSNVHAISGKTHTNGA